MQSELTSERGIFLSTTLAGRREVRFALAALLVSVVIFLAAAPFAKTPLAQLPAFISTYESALVICDLITAVLLFGRFRFLHSRALFVLASGYLFTAFMTVSHALTFPGLFSPTGLLGAGPQTTAWLYSFWHGGFPLVIIAYALLKDKGPEAIATGGRPREHFRFAILSSIAAVAAIVCGLTLFATVGHAFLPTIMQSNRITIPGQIILSSVWALSLLALVVLWRRRPHSVLELWLMIVMCAWLFDIALAAILNAGRYDLGWYAGRIYGLLAASFVLAVLLIENGKHYAQLVHMSAKQAAILNALPAHIALLDKHGLIMSVNEAWRRFGSANAVHGPGYGIGVNYLEICDRAGRDDSSEAHQVAAGIRSVLRGVAKSFSIEYSSHSPAEQRWFLLTVTPLADERPNGAVVMHLNITERRRTQLALVQSEAGLHRAQLVAKLAHVITGADGAFERWSETLPQLIGVEPAQLPRTIRAWLDIVHPDDRALFREKAIEAGVKKLRAELEFRLRRADGQWIHLRQTIEPLQDEDDTVRGARWFSTMQDVTAEKQTEESLRASESRLRQMAENIRDVFFLIDADSNRVLYISPAYEEIWGRSCESLYANPLSWTEAVHPDDRASTYEQYKQGMSAGEFEYEYRIVRPDGSVRWIEMRGFPVRDDAGKIVRITGVAEDITEGKKAAQDLRESERRFSDMLENVELASVMLDREARITYCNEYLLRLTGWRHEEVIGRDWYELFVPLELGDMKPVFLALLANLPEAWHRENEIVTRWGERRLIRWNNSVLRSGDGEVIGIASIGEDITEQMQAEIRINHLNRVYAMLSGINTLIVRVRDRDELFREACRLAVEGGGFRMSLIGIVERSAMRIVPVASAGKDEELMSSIKSILSSSEGAPSTMVAQAIREKKAVVSNDSQSDPKVLFGKKYAESGVRSMAVLPLIVANEAAGVLALYAGEREFFHEEEMKLLTDLAGDIAFAMDHIEKEEKLNYLAYYDVLTGLANRSLFLERVAPYIRSADSGRHQLAVFLIDLERFKNINDSLGRPAGDALLRQVAEWLTRNAGDANLLARVGADHFAAVLPEVKQEGGVAQLLEKTMAAFLDHPFRLNDSIFRVAAKVGVALFPQDGSDADTLFKHAEAALKKAKASGDRFLFYTQKMTATVAAKLTLENQLRQALDKEEFVLHYQPKVNLESGKLTSAEALIRWNDPRTGLVPPGKFIPILEETGLINEVGRWALRKAIADYLRWRTAGLAAVRIAVNVSPLQLRNRGFIAEINQAIGIDAPAAAGLELEITESVIMEDVKHSIATLQAIRAMGVTIAIDDFGTGFSSLSSLAKLPVDTLKIDRSFVIDMTAGPQGLALVSTIINLAHSLKLKVVAEGVETEEQSRLLSLLNCDEMQGYLFSRPVPCEIFEARFLAPPPADKANSDDDTGGRRAHRHAPLI
jgi:diguanylate cyclase (GGDEF)-like protein/PAS domain S-box-containing protein